MPSAVMNHVECWLEPTSTVGATETIGPAFLQGVKEIGLYAEFSEKAVGGAVLIESAHDEAYTGRWAPVVKISCVEGGAVEYRALTGVHGALRARVVEPPMGGTVAVYVLGT